MRIKDRTSPRPWSINPEWVNEPDSNSCVTPPPILDADGLPVLETSEWLMGREGADLDIFDNDIRLIVEAVNAYDK